MQQRLIKAGLVFFGHNQEAVFVFLKIVFNVTAGETVEAGFIIRTPLVIFGAGKGNDGFVRRVDFLQVRLKSPKVFNGVDDAGGDYHCFGLPANLFGFNHLIKEVLNHNFCFLADAVGVAFYVLAQPLVGPPAIELGIVFYFLEDFVIAVVGGVIFQHVHDKAFFDGLLHGVNVERVIFAGQRMLHAKGLQGSVFGRGGEGKVAGVGQHLLTVHQGIDGIFIIFDFGDGIPPQSQIHFGSDVAALAAVGFVDDDSKGFATHCPQLFQHKRKGLNGGNNDFLARFQGFGQFGTATHGRYHPFHVGILFDGVPNLAIKDHSIGYNNDGVEDGFVGVEAG